MADVESTNSPKRLLFVDGLRGVASLMVVFYHLNENLRPAVAAWFPRILDALFGHFNLGVDIFFVLSGFVITYSVRNGLHTWRYLGRFALRRSIRLDPPLWVTILLEVALIHVSLYFFPALGTPTPGWKEILSNVTYTQRFLGYPDVAPVFWSLTYEVQFYLVLVVALVLYHTWVGRKLKRSGVPPLVRLIFLSSVAYSLAIWIGVVPLPLRGLFIDRWFQFSLGVAACSVFLGKTSLRAFGILCAAVVLPTFIVDPGLYRVLTVLTAVGTAAALVQVGRARAMDRVLSGRTIQFLGRISYSLYLIHLSVGWRFVSLCRQLLGPNLSVLEGLIALGGGVLLSILAAWLMYRLLEAPSLRIAHRVRLPRRLAAAAASGAPPPSSSGASAN